MLSAVFIVGRLGKIEGDHRYILVEKVPEPNAPFRPEENYDRLRVRMWSNIPGILNRLPEGQLVTIKGRLEEKKGEMIIVCELLRG